MTSTILSETHVKTDTATQVVTEQKVQEIHKTLDPEAIAAEIDALSNEKMEEYYVEREKLQKRIKELSAIGDQPEIDVVQATLDNVEREIAKRSERVGTLVASIGAELSMFADLGDMLMQDTEEDIAKREGAQELLEEAEKALINLKASIKSAKDDQEGLSQNVENAKKALTEAKGSWKFWSKKTTIQLAENALAEAKRKYKTAKAIVEVGPDTVQDMEIAIEEAKVNIVSTEEEIKVDKDQRLKDLDLDRLYARITKAEKTLSGLTEEAINATQDDITATEIVLGTDRKFAIDSARNLEEIKNSLVDIEFEFEQAKELLGEQTPNSERYHEVRNEVADLAAKLDELNNRRKIVSDNISTAEVNIRETETTLRTLKTDLLMAKRNYNDFVISVEKARVVGENLVRMLKNQPLKVAGSSIAKGRNAITLAVLDAANSTTVATEKELADRAEDKVDLLAAMKKKEEVGSAAIAEQRERHDAAEEAYEEQYAEFDEGGITHLEESDAKDSVEDAETKEKPKKLYT